MLEINDIVLFDGLCNLCSGAVKFILTHEKSETLKFASLQSETGSALVMKFKIDPSVDSIVLISDHKAYIKSDAAIRIASYLKRPWSWISHTGFIPLAWRNSLYDFIARNRYRFFGKKEECWLPQPRWRMRFL